MLSGAFPKSSHPTMRAPSRLCQKLLEAVLPDPRGHHWSPKAKTPEDFRFPTQWFIVSLVSLKKWILWFCFVYLL